MEILIDKIRSEIRSNKNFWKILAAIILIGASLRICGLTHQSMWLDEANGIRIAQKSFSGIISELTDDVSPPLHYLILHLWIKIFGSGEISTRLFSAIFGVLFIPAICYVGTSLFNRRIGLISAFIVSISQFHIRYSQEVRMYSMLVIVGLFSMYFLYKAATENTRSFWVGYTLFTVLTIYTHNYGTFIAISEAAFFVIYARLYKANWKKFITTQCIIIAAYLPWLIILATEQLGSPALKGWMAHTGLYHIYETFKVYSGFDLYMFNPVINVLTKWPGLALFLCCFLVGIFSIRRPGRIPIPYIEINPKLLLLLCYLFITLAIPMLISIKKPIYVPNRYSIAAWPAFPLIIGSGLSKIKNLRKLLFLLALILFFSSISLYTYYFSWVKSYDREIARLIKSKASAGDVIIYAPSWIDISIDYYIKRYLHTPIKSLGFPWRSKQEVNDGRRGRYMRSPYEIASLARSRAGSSRKIFLIRQESVTWVANMDTVKRVFDRSFMELENVKYDDMEVTIYR